MKKQTKKVLSCAALIAMLTSVTGALVGCDGEEKTAIVMNSARGGLKAYETLALGVSYEETWENPYDSSEIALDALIKKPDGSTETVPMFWYQDYERDLRYGTEILCPKGEAFWALRYTPTESGKYTVSIRKKQNGVTETDNNVYSLTVKPGDKDAFLRVAEDKTYLEFSNGRSFVGIGNNLCGWEWSGSDNQAGTYDYDKWLNELKTNDANLTQFDLCEGDNIEWTKNEEETAYSSAYGGIGSFNQEAAWKTDYKIKKSEDFGIYYRLSLYHWEDFDREEGNFPDWGWSRNPYNRENGGPCETVSDFFKGEEAKAYAKNYIRYCVARWGYSANLLAWELWNEADSPDMAYASGEGFATEASAICDWHEEMSEYLHSLDVNNHLVTTSFAQAGNYNKIWEQAGMDITTFHRYTQYNPEDEGLYNGVGVIANTVKARLAQFGKPVIAGEFALSGGGGIQRENDPDGIGFHNQIWSSLFAGSFGTAMHWTWGSYIDQNDLYGQYKPLSALLRYEDLRGMTRTNNVNQKADAHIYMTMQSENRAFLWVKDRNYDFRQVVNEGYKAALMKDVSVSLSGLKSGDYAVTFYDTYSGEEIATNDLTVSDGTAVIAIPDFYKDIAAKVILKSTAWTSIDIGSSGANSSTRYSGDTVNLYATGADIAGMSDAGRFAYLTVTGDFDMVAKVTRCTYLGEHTKAGIMLRQSVSGGSKMAFIGLNGAGDATFASRNASGTMANMTDWTKSDIGSYVKLERRGATVRGYLSADGKKWTLIGENEFTSLRDELLIGVMASSRNTLGYNDALFEYIKFTPVTGK